MIRASPPDPPPPRLICPWPAPPAIVTAPPRPRSVEVPDPACICTAPPAELASDSFPAWIFTAPPELTSNEVAVSDMLNSLSSFVVPTSPWPLMDRDPPPNAGSASMSKFPTTVFTPTKLSGHGRSKTVPRQSKANTCATVTHWPSLAQYAQSGFDAQSEQESLKSPQFGRAGQSAECCTGSSQVELLGTHWSVERQNAHASAFAHGMHASTESQ